MAADGFGALRREATRKRRRGSANPFQAATAPTGRFQQHAEHILTPALGGCSAEDVDGAGPGEHPELGRSEVREDVDGRPGGALHRVLSGVPGGRGRSNSTPKTSGQNVKYRAFRAGRAYAARVRSPQQPVALNILGWACCAGTNGLPRPSKSVQHERAMDDKATGGAVLESVDRAGTMDLPRPALQTPLVPSVRGVAIDVCENLAVLGGSGKSGLCLSVLNDATILLYCTERPLQAVDTSEDARPAADTSEDARPLMDCLPVDWSLKHKLRFTSSVSFDWAKQLKSSSTARGLSAYARGTSRVDSSDQGAALQQALMYYEHPSTGWSQALIDACQTMGVPDGLGARSKKAKRDSGYVDSLFEEWTAAFRSLYHGLRAGEIPFFYVHGHELSALFRGPGIGGFSQLSATLSHSTKGLRAILERDDVPFCLPMAPDFEEQQRKAEQLKNDLQTLSKEAGLTTQFSAGRKEALAIDKTSASMLHFEGHEGVHGFFEFVLNMKFASAHSVRTHPPPHLYSSREFLHGTLKALKVHYAGPEIAMAKRQPGRASAMRNAHALELHGPCLPHTVFALCKLLDSTQGGDLEATVVESSAGTGAFNHFVKEKVKSASPSCDDDLTTVPASCTDANDFLRTASTLGTAVLAHLCKKPDVDLTWTTKKTK